LTLDKSTPASSSPDYLPGFKSPEAKSASAFHDEIHATSEHTLGGTVIGKVRDFFCGQASSAEARSTQAKSNDEMALIAADTMAALPMVKTFTAGIVRASILVDPHKSISDNAASFGLNLAEGLALNKVSKLTLPESGLSQYTASRLGTGLVAESATHLSAGFGFGAIRAGFNPDTWKDQSGNFDAKTGSENLLKAGAVGALFNLPAGMIGSRVARASSGFLLSTEISGSARMAQAVAGISSGYAAGGVFGGLDAVMQGKGVSGILEGINQGGMVGAFGGGLMGSLQKPHELPTLRQSSDNRNGAPASELRLETQNATDNQAGKLRSFNGEITDDLVLQRRQRWFPETEWTTQLFDKLNFAPKTERIAEVTKRLIPQPNEERSFYRSNPEEQGPFKDFNDFFSRVQTEKRDYRVYTVKDQPVKIAIPEDYAQSLDQVRAARITMAKPSMLDSLNPKLKLDVLEWLNQNDAKSRLKLAQVYSPDEIQQLKSQVDIKQLIDAAQLMKTHPHAQRALPEDIIPLIDELPNRTTVKNLIMVDEPFYQDPWLRFQYKPTFKAAATAESTTGTVTFYETARPLDGAPQTSNTIRSKLFHEDSHLVPNMEEHYEPAAALEKDGFYTSEYSRRNVDENYAEHRGTVFLMPDGDEFLAMAEEAPLRTIVIARQLAKTLSDTPKDMQSPYADKFQNRVQFVEDHIVPWGRELLKWHLENGDVASKTNAAKLLGLVGTEEHIDILKPHLRLGGVTDNGKPIPEAELAKTAFNSINEILKKTPDQQFDFLVEQGRPGQPFREQALDLLAQTDDPRRFSYGRLLHLAGSSDNMRAIVDLIPSMYGRQGAQMAFNEVINLSKDSPFGAEFRTSLAMKMLNEAPHLRADALKVLRDSATAETLPTLRKLVGSSDAEVRRISSKIVSSIVGEQVTALRDKGAPVSSQMVKDLLSTNDNDAVKPLLRVAVSPFPSAREAQAGLERFNSQIVRYYAQRLQSENIPPYEKHAVKELSMSAGRP
jgi:hypothetical protein